METGPFQHRNHPDLSDFYWNKHARQLDRLGLQNVKRFSWENSARRLDEIIEKEVTG